VARLRPWAVRLWLWLTLGLVMAGFVGFAVIVLTAPDAVKRETGLTYPGITAGASRGDARLMFYQAEMYFTGEGVARDRREALRWLMRSAEAGYRRAQTALGLFYFKGPQPNPPLAVLWLTRAAAQGDRAARGALHELYRDGAAGVAADPALAEQIRREMDR